MHGDLEMPLDEKTASYQMELAQVCRDGKITPIPGVTEESAQVYRDLVRNGIEDTLRRAYPIAHAYLHRIESTAINASSLSLWNTLVDRFIAEGNLQTPELWRMPENFLEFIIDQKSAETYNLPYLEDLLEFEWSEIELFMMPDRIDPLLYRTKKEGEGLIIPTPEFDLLNLKYPVFRINPEELPKEEGQFFLLVFRHPLTRLVRFIELSPLVALVIESLTFSPQSRGQLIERCFDFLVATVQMVQPQEIVGEKKEVILKQIDSFIDQAIGEGFICYAAN